MYAASGVFPSSLNQDEDEDEDEDNKDNSSEFVAWYTLDQLRTICEAAVKAVELDVSSSHVVWNAWRDVEMRVLEVLLSLFFTMT